MSDREIEIPGFLHADQAHTEATRVQQGILLRAHEANIQAAQRIAQQINAAIQKGKYSVSTESRPNPAIQKWLDRMGYKVISDPRGWNEEHYRISFEHAKPTELSAEV